MTTTSDDATAAAVALLANEPPAPVKTCYMCGLSDDHPKYIYITDSAAATDESDEPYHYDCIPHGIRVSQGIPDDHVALVATTDGLRGDDVRVAMVVQAIADYDADMGTRDNTDALAQAADTTDDTDNEDGS